MFDKDRFIEDCKVAAADGQVALREVVAEAVSQRASLMAELGEPQHAGITPLYRSPELTIINFVWAPCMNLLPHNHQMTAVIGIYEGREDNIFWRRTEGSIEAAGAKSLGAGDVATLGRDIIHSVLNPLARMSCAIHVYTGNFFEPHEPRSQWEHASLREQPYDIEQVRAVFSDAEARFNAAR